MFLLCGASSFVLSLPCFLEIGDRRVGNLVVGPYWVICVPISAQSGWPFIN